jgi:UDP-N-acetylglucosamine 4,6-dehydratase
LKVVVTGGTGSFGRAFTRYCQRERDDVTRLISLSRDEVKADDIGLEFASYPKFRAYLGDVRDVDRLCQAFRGSDVVIHAAALKRVNAHTDGGELIKTNTIGTVNVVNACLSSGVRRLVFISSDKAVEPMNQYGKTKASAEGFVVGANAYDQDFKACVVRYGNVLGSRGSVIQLWKEALQSGQQVKLTDERMTRFWMRLRDAVTLVWTAIDNMQGGEIFIPRIGAAPVKSLLGAVHELSGQKTTAPEPIISGIRAGGEKLHEKLVSTEEISRTLIHSNHDVLMVTPPQPTWTRSKWMIGDAASDAFTYRSNDAFHQLTCDELRELVIQAESDGY